MAALAILEREVPVARDEFGEVGFTEKDRELLTQLEVRYEHIHDLMKDFRSSFEERMQRLERTGAFKEDLERMERELRRDLAEKANRTELPGSAVTQLQEKAQDFDRRITYAYAFAAGAAFVIAAIIAVAVKLLWR